MSGDQYLTAKQIAELFQLNVDTVYDLAGNGRIPATKIGGRWRFDPEELRDWFKTHRLQDEQADDTGRA